MRDWCSRSIIDCDEYKLQPRVVGSKFSEIFVDQANVRNKFAHNSSLILDSLNKY